MVDRHGVRPDPEAVEAVLTWKAPRTDTQLLSFLGFANYYREFMKGHADKVYPMQKLMRNKWKKFEWNDEAQVAFENIKRELCKAPVLGMPTEKGMYVLDTDASVVAISGILHQEQETVTFVDQDKEGEKVERNLVQDCLSGETNDEKSQRVQDQHPGKEVCPGSLM